MLIRRSIRVSSFTYWFRSFTPCHYIQYLDFKFSEKFNTTLVNFLFLQDALKIEPYSPGCLNYIIHTKVGGGPKVLTDEQEHLLNSGGMPKYVSP